MEKRSVRTLRESHGGTLVFAPNGRMEAVFVTGDLSARLRGRPWVVVGALAIGLAACGGGGDVTSTGTVANEAPAADVSEAEAAAATNQPLLQPANQVVDFEVLDVADGSIATLSEAVTGDRPVLLWFFSPH